MFKKILILFVAFSLLFSITKSVQAATNLIFSPTKISVKAGQTFRLSIGVNPNGVKNYTVQVSVKFPADLVKISTWSFGVDWMPLRKPEYDSFNNTNGTLVRTAGFPEGFNKITNFGSAVFVAQKDGEGFIEFAGKQLALDENSNNVYIGGNKIDVMVTETATTGESIMTENEQAPEQLFDIGLKIDNPKVQKIGDLSAQVSFASFGKVPTPIEMTFDILDKTNTIIHSEKNTEIVEIEKIFNKSFSGLDLPPGDYTLKLTTLYNTNIQDEFHAPFQIAAKINWIPWTVGMFVFLILAFVILKLKRRKNNT